MILKPKKIDYSKFTKDNKNLEVKYGLPAEVKFCKNCIITNQRPNSTIEFLNNSDKSKKTINFDDDNICDACKYSFKKNKEIDWNEREKELIELCNKHRKDNGEYDCIVPGSGGKDSFYASHILKYKYKMNPLTVTWAPHIYTEWGWKNFEKWIHSGMDNYLMTPNGKVHRLLTRLSTDVLFHPFQPFMIGQKLVAPKMAALFKTPLIFYGENEAEYGNPISDTNNAIRNKDYYASNEKNIYLGGIHINELIEKYGVLKSELAPYLPLNLDIHRNLEIQTHYLGYYLKWHPQSCYYYASEKGGFEASPERTPGTYSKYNSIDDKIDDFHYYTTGIKFGIGRASYDAAQEIRSLDIDRDEGISLIKRYDHEFPDRFKNEIFQYLSINKKDFPIASKMFEQSAIDDEYFENLTNQFRSPHIWYYEENSNTNQQWYLRNIIK
ncbi:N-acetyl sugar amidotransferase [Candidatus Pelagibacter sp.]|jgi:N-acetyl sugar amidotransferase|nr:N-acetyl sugar amidotransferase [Candidatus Pelagibacter sp.]